MKMEIRGVISQVLPEVSGVSRNSNATAWRKRQYVVESGGQYPSVVCFTLWGGDNIDRFALKEGEHIVAQADVRSEEWKGNWYTDIRVWRVEREAVVPQEQVPAGTPLASAGMEDLDVPF